ncbi:hypothetical protein XENTR_v10010979 [Xenopus tropicalis]|nr:hypothetical protein XENTR_v10010979 [Xenopus tropicalis]
MLQPGNYSLVLSLQFLLLLFDLFVNSFSELLRDPPVNQLVLFILQDVGILFAAIVLFLMLFNTFVFQAGLVSLLCQRFQVTVILCAVYIALSISLHVWLMVRALLMESVSPTHQQCLFLWIMWVTNSCYVYYTCALSLS